MDGLSEYMLEHEKEIVWLMAHYKSSRMLTLMRAKLHNLRELSPNDFKILTNQMQEPTDPFTATIARNMTHEELHSYSDCSAAVRTEIINRFPDSNNEYRLDIEELEIKIEELEEEYATLLEANELLAEELEELRP